MMIYVLRISFDSCSLSFAEAVSRAKRMRKNMKDTRSDNTPWLKHFHLMSHVDIVIQGSAVFAACLDMEADLDQAVKDIFGIFPGVYKVELTKGANIQQVIKKKLPCNSEVLEYSGKQIAAAA